MNPENSGTNLALLLINGKFPVVETDTGHCPGLSCRLLRQQRSIAERGKAFAKRDY